MAKKGLVAWSEAERLAWRPPERLTPSAWAERYRVLSRRQSSRPGEWRNANSPALVGLMDLCSKGWVRKLNIRKAGQVGASEAVRNVLGYYAHQEPDPVLLVLPDEKSGRRIMRRNILPLIEDTPVLRELSTAEKRDKKVTEILLANGWNLTLGWAGSAASLASIPCRIVVNDEVDKMKAWVGKEADPLSLAEVRTATYANSLIVNLSTPTTRDGLITTLYEASEVKLDYYVPCPHCGKYQRLTFDRLKWEKPTPAPATAEAHAAWIEAHRAAWYECEGCGGKITDQHRPTMLRSGYWGTADGGYKLWYGGQEEGTPPLGSSVGVHLWAIHSLAPKHRLTMIAAEFIRSKGDPMKLQNFRNSWLGECYETQVAERATNVFAAKCQGAAPARVLPSWTAKLILTADTQKDHFYWVIRAWGAGYRSRRVAHGKALSFEELRAIAFESFYPFEDESQGAMACDLVGIDSGGGMRVIDEYGIDASRTDEVYRFALSDPHRIKALRGDPNPSPGQAIRLRKVTYTPPRHTRSSYQVWLHQLDVGWFQDILDSRLDMKTPIVDTETGEVTGEEDIWQLNEVSDEDYNRQMASMHKIVINPRSREMRWVVKTAGAANHYRDCEVYQFAMAYGPARVGELAAERRGERAKTSWFASRKKKAGVSHE